MADDPFAALGLGPDASADDVRARRRELAKEHHPDHGGDADRMRAVNSAAAAALAAIADRTRADGPPSTGAADVAPPTTRPGDTVGRDDGRRDGGDTRTDHAGFVRDVPSFTVEALPVETFEAMLVVASWVGEVLDDDPPYRLDVHLREPAECWCRLDVVPDAGASTVSITVGALDGTRPPAVEAVRDLWVDLLNRLDWDA